MTKALTAEELAAELGVSLPRAYQLLSEGRIQGARKHSGVWVIQSPVVRLDPPRQKKGAGED